MDIRTRQGHRVHVLAGDPQGIIDRGEEIENLGEQMIGAAGVLKAIGDGATEERGRSIDKIRSEVGDTHEELALAGERYKPTGTAMKRYGSELATIQAAMRTIVAEAQDAKTRLDAKVAAAESASDDADASADHDPTDTTAKTQHEQNQKEAKDAASAAASAEATLDGHLDEFDTQWGLWDQEYEKALAAVEDATSGNVSDDWTDNLAGVVDVVLKVLTWVGVALAIAALIVGGPFIAALAAIVALVVLVGTVFLYFKGRRTGGDIGWAVLGVLPFGKLAKVFRSSKGLQTVKEMAKLPITEITTPIRRIRDLRGLANPAAFRAAGMTRRGARGLANEISTSFSNFGGWGARTIPSRILGGSSRAYAVEFAQTFAKFPPHQQKVMQPLLGSLQDVVESGGASVHRLDQVGNVTDFVLKRGRMTGGRLSDLTSWTQPQPVDTWRTELRA